MTERNLSAPLVKICFKVYIGLKLISYIINFRFMENAVIKYPVLALLVTPLYLLYSVLLVYLLPPLYL